MIKVNNKFNFKANLDSIYEKFDSNGALKVKSIEKVINHDVKAIEYFIKESLE